MDIKNSPPNSARPTLDRVSAVRTRQTSTADVGSDSQRTDASTTATETLDVRSTQRLVEVGREEALAIHESALAELREQIAAGTYSADLDVVAERVAEVLGVP